jgi:hypothetical protein
MPHRFDTNIGAKRRKHKTAAVGANNYSPLVANAGQMTRANNYSPLHNCLFHAVDAELQTQHVSVDHSLMLGLSTQPTALMVRG